MPDRFPDALVANRAAAVAEIALGPELLPGRTRRAAEVGPVVLLVAMFPANVDMALNRVGVEPVGERLTRSVGAARRAGHLDSPAALAATAVADVGVARAAGHRPRRRELAA